MVLCFCWNFFWALSLSLNSVLINGALLFLKLYFPVFFFFTFLSMELCFCWGFFGSSLSLSLSKPLFFLKLFLGSYYIEGFGFFLLSFNILINGALFFVEGFGLMHWRNWVFSPSFSFLLNGALFFVEVLLLWGVELFPHSFMGSVLSVNFVLINGSLFLKLFWLWLLFLIRIHFTYLLMKLVSI